MYPDELAGAVGMEAGVDVVVFTVVVSLAVVLDDDDIVVVDIDIDIDVVDFAEVVVVVIVKGGGVCVTATVLFPVVGATDPGQLAADDAGQQA